MRELWAGCRHWPRSEEWEDCHEPAGLGGLAGGCRAADQLITREADLDIVTQQTKENAHAIVTGSRRTYPTLVAAQAAGRDPDPVACLEDR